MIIDSHEHVMTPTELQLKKMEQAGVDKTILFCTAPHPEKAKTLSDMKAEMGALYKILSGSNTKEDNIRRMKDNIEELTQIIKKYPDKFYGFGAVPLGLSVEETKVWIKEYIVANNLKGVGEFTPGSDEQIVQLEPIFQALEYFQKLPIWVHTFDPVSATGIKLLTELTRKYPKVSVIFGHMGGYHWMEVIEFAKSVSNAYIDLSGAFAALAVRIATTELPDKCLYGSDAPYGEPLLSKQLIEYVCTDNETREKILGGNILRLIGEEGAN